ncbi:hypothetical protein DOY81_014348 [Sarcophaga bullata]|nr:hypothetical protein DOY81_014348 [Sarcophaga bullata]
MWTEPPPPPKPKKKKTKTEIDEEGNEVIIELSEDESSDEEEEELPHHRIVRNIRRFFAEVKDKDLRARITEDILHDRETPTELHRKLSEIAEIPKILSSTLATVSQTFDKLTNSSLTASPPTFNAHCEQKRKMSYDEDVYDYELSDDNDAFKPSDEEEEFNVKRAYLQLKRYAARQRKSKDVTPESDYASETNFQTHETNDWQAIDNTLNGKLANESIDNKDSMDEDEDDDDDEKSCDMYEEFTLSLFNKSHHNGHESESDIEEYDIENDDKPDDDDDDIADGDDDASDDDDDDFLTTTLTWNLSNKSKLQRNDSRNSNNSSNTDDNYEDIDDNANKSLNVQQHSYLGEGNILKQIQQIKGNTPEKDQKVG